MKSELIKEIALTFELCGGVKPSDGAAGLVVQGLECYTEEQIRKALARCRSECRGRLTPADIEHRIDDGRPSPDEAWAMCPKSESQSVCWTTEMSHAYGIACSLIGQDDVAARMAFISAYRTAVQNAKAQRLPVKWEVSFGNSANEREDCVLRALQEDKITQSKALMLAPGIETKLLPSAPDAVGQLVGKLADKMSV